MKRRARLTVAGGLALVLVAGACGGGDGGDEEARFTAATAPSPTLVESLPSGFPGEESAVKDTFVGLAGEATKIGVALVRRGDEVAVYLCDGQGVSDWFAGNLDGERLRLQSAEGTTLDASLADGGFSGTVAVHGGPPTAFTAPPALPGETGISVRRLPAGSLRWILTQEGIYGAIEDSGGKTVSTTSSTGTSSGTSGSGTSGSSTAPPPQPRSNPCAGGACDSLSCGQLTSLFNGYMNGFLTAKTKPLKDAYFNGGLSILEYGTAHGCNVNP
ncbi:MAG TPA: hypothetical protein VG078_04170 [Acidimicrobiales bacterium]|nr:hypothetical protein [Acidimicrobiales bacterium]